MPELYMTNKGNAILPTPVRLIGDVESTETYSAGAITGGSGKCLSAPVAITCAMRLEGSHGAILQAYLSEKAPTTALKKAIDMIVSKAPFTATLAPGDAFALGAVLQSDILGVVRFAEADYINVGGLASLAENKKEMAFQVRSRKSDHSLGATRELYYILVSADGGSPSYVQNTAILSRLTIHQD